MLSTYVVKRETEPVGYKCSKSTTMVQQDIYTGNYGRNNGRMNKYRCEGSCLIHGTTDGIVLAALLEQMEYHLDTMNNLGDAKCEKIKKVCCNFLPWINY
jgi:hypothetical protein